MKPRIISLSHTEQDALLASHQELLDWIQALLEGDHCSTPATAQPRLERARAILKQINQEQAAQTDAVCRAYRDEAQNHVNDGELEVDDDSLVSLSSDGGAYVQAWVWIGAQEAGVSPDPTI